MSDILTRFYLSADNIIYFNTNSIDLYRGLDFPGLE